MVLRPVLPPYKPPPDLKWLPRMGSNGQLYKARGPPGTGDKDKEGDGGGQGAPEVDATPMGFLKRYWYILLPLLLSNFLGGSEPAAPQEGQASGGQQGAVAPGGGAATPSAAPAEGGGARKRRGKRD
jgi:hypothetical protein